MLRGGRSRMVENEARVRSPWAFYVKCRPQSVDAASIALKERRVFVGYPPWRRGCDWDRHHVSRCLLNLAVNDSQWSTGQLDEELDSSYRRHITLNRGFARQVAKGDVVILPRPGEGICYLGRIAGAFELVDDPQWGEEFLRLKAQSDSSNVREQDISEVVQCWQVDDWKRCAFPLVPRWVSYRLLSRNTIGWIEDQPLKGLKVYNALSQIIDEPLKPALFERTSDPAEIERRVLSWIAPASFEQLVCELLQLENPQEHWWHIGGAGDGGCDGMAVDDQGRVSAALQCKWMSDENPYELGESLRRQFENKWALTPRIYVAMLFHPPSSVAPTPTITFLGSQGIARLLMKHASSVPIAMSLGMSAAFRGHASR